MGNTIKLESHLKLVSEELLDWSILLYYFSWADSKHNLVVADDKTMTTPEMVICCKECADKAHRDPIVKSFKTIYDPSIDTFPPKSQDMPRDTIYAALDRRFYEYCVDTYEMVSRDAPEKIYYPYNYVRETCLEHIFEHIKYRELEPLPPDKHSCFKILAYEAHALYFIFGDYLEYGRVLKDMLPAEELYHIVVSMKDTTIGDAREAIGHWKLADLEKKLRKSWAKKGGSASKRLPGILAAIKKVLQEDNRQSYSTERLWEYFERNHKGKKNPVRVGGFKIYFNYKDLNTLEGGIYQISPTGENAEPRGRSAFTGYVREAKKSLT